LITIPGFGRLVVSARFIDVFFSSPIPVPFFDGLPLRFVFDGLGETDEADLTAAIAAFLDLGGAVRGSASSLVFESYQRTATVDGDLVPEIKPEVDLWKHVRPKEIFVSRNSGLDQRVYVQILAECDWDPEHGIQLSFRAGKDLIRVGEQDGSVP
jgi:hypothetical protein